ncbi:hypothetical protein F5Y16DRAFT_388713 [Xylariaceae sp. FL0255]|nr:hypothetical protein F5Y16DRAFT_388713 [Xylariaceae sp. FL0255]
MTSLHEITIPYLTASLKTLQGLIAKTEELAASQGKTGNDLLGLSIHENMWPLAQQFNIIAIHAMGGVAKATSTAPPSVAFGPVSSIDEAKKQVADVLAYVQGCKPEAINGKEANVTGAKVGPGDDLPVTVYNYITGYMIPQISFHLTTVYDILRANGASLSKGDYLKAYVVPYKG